MRPLSGPLGLVEKPLLNSCFFLAATLGAKDTRCCCCWVRRINRIIPLGGLCLQGPLPAAGAVFSVKHITVRTRDTDRGTTAVYRVWKNHLRIIVLGYTQRAQNRIQTLALRSVPLFGSCVWFWPRFSKPKRNDMCDRNHNFHTVLCQTSKSAGRGSRAISKENLLRIQCDRNTRCGKIEGD